MIESAFVYTGIALAALGAIVFLVFLWDVFSKRWEAGRNFEKPTGFIVDSISMSGSDDLADLFRTRWDNFFRRSPDVSSHNGFINFPTPEMEQIIEKQVNFDDMENFSLTVHGVDVAAPLKIVKDLAKRDAWKLEGRVQKVSDRIILYLFLKRGAATIKTWNLHRPLTVVEGEASESEIIERLLDDAIFQIVFDLKYRKMDEAELETWERAFPRKKEDRKFTSATEVADFYRSRHFFYRYYQNQRSTDLEDAITALENSRAHRPSDFDTLLMLGITLTENREETRAVESFARAIAGIKEKLESHPDPALQSRLRRARLLHAIAEAQQFTPSSAHSAETNLAKLEKEIAEALGYENLTTGIIEVDKRDPGAFPETKETAAAGEEGTSRKNGKERQWSEDEWALWELRAHVMIQRALIRGRYLAYLRTTPIEKIFETKDAPDALRLTETLDGKDPAEVSARVRQQVGLIWRDFEQLIGGAQTVHDSLNAAGQEDGNRTFFLNLAQGYGHLRLAAWLEKGDEKDPDHQDFRNPSIDSFNHHIDEAIKALEEADLVHTNRYYVQQYLGLIHADRRYDLKGNHSVRAEEYFEESIAMNPRGYYSHAQLAKLMMKKVARDGLVSDLKPDLLRGVEAADTYAKLEPDHGVAHLYRVQLRTMLAELAKDEEERNKFRREADEIFPRIGIHLKPQKETPDRHFHWLKIIRRVPELRAAAASALGRLPSCEISLESVRKNANDDDAAVKKAAVDAVQAVRKDLSKIGDILQDLNQEIGSTEQENTLLGNCGVIERNWVAKDFLFENEALKNVATELKTSLGSRSDLPTEAFAGLESALALESEDWTELKSSLDSLAGIRIPWISSPAN